MLKDKLIIFLETNIQQSNWFVLHDQQIIAEGECSQMNGIKTYLSHTEIIIVVPATDVCLHRLTMPKMSHARLLQTIPYALEDQVIAELQDLHFAFKVIGEWIHVAVVHQEKMQHWLNTLNDWGVQPHRLLSLNMLVPKAEEAWHLFNFSSTCMLNIGEEHAIVCDLNNAPLILEQALEQSSNVPALLHVYYTCQHPLPNLNFKNAINVEVCEHQCDKYEYFMALLPQLNAPNTINLLQQRFAVKQSKANIPLQVKQLGYLLCTLVMILFVYPLISWILLAAKVSEQNQQITRIYKRYFPQATSLIAPKLRMQTKLENVHDDTHQAKILLMLSKIAESKSTIADIHLQRFIYADNRLVLEVKASSVDDVVQFQNALLDQGLNVKQQNATVGDDAVNASLLVE